MSPLSPVTTPATLPSAARTGHPEIHVADFTGAGIITARITDGTLHTARTPASGQPLSAAAVGDDLYFTTWSSPLGDGTLQKMPRSGGSTEAVATGLRCPVGVAADDHAVYVATFYGMLHVFPHTSEPFRINLAERLTSPNGVALHDGTLYLVDWDAGSVAALDTSGLTGPGAAPAIRTVVRPGGLTQPGHIAAGDGALYVTQAGGARGLDGTIERIDLGTESPRPETLVDRLPYPTGIALHDGTLYTSTVDGRCVLAIGIDGTAQAKPVITGLETPWGLAI
ncbi:hypothetical protein [Tomitella cavernea]|uniref:SMP-30/Gluconolactonase/LRE-like region domain-containing protein n=1 Tax=Tomitella cavernea TaxID=1387982 RepID=A0ABP9D541_9ACTN|nr:hypothetical protein [Tomitella cavernea]